MGDFEATWRLVRGRFDEAVSGLSQKQLNWRMHPESLTLGEMAVHVAGVEVSFISQLTGDTLPPEKERVRAASTDGCLNDRPFPFEAAELTPDFVERTLAEARAYAEPYISNPESVRTKEIVSALGPVIDGTGAMARLAYHPGYHQGQAYLIKTAPGFPS
ncbi:MAG TPA: DinB family protein [Fimbriimonas sp.]|nr:DinB family protein [Fimbriimonas sp.]